MRPPPRRFFRSKARAVSGGLKLRAGRGKVGETWWGRRWTAALESFGWQPRLERGKVYAKKGQVLAVRVAPGKVRARVQGSRGKPYEVTIALAVLAAKDWRRVAAAVSRQALLPAQLLAFEMPRDIEDAFPKAKPLFPASRQDIAASCTCPDAANPCKHIAAVHFILAQEFDRDPFLLFTLRGISRTKLLTLLRSSRSPVRRAGPKKEPAGADLSGRIEGFFALPKELPAGWGPSPARLERAPLPGARLKELGVPPFWRGELDFEETLLRYLEAARARAEALLRDC
ncbi:MAG: SWIM zinc finger family protein [Elusimicrobia bacterium]|nr:SWIM zinc finger family protein [Elusimicrobiota bacterium]